MSTGFTEPTEFQSSYTINSDHTTQFGNDLEKVGRFLTAPAGKFLSVGYRLIRPPKLGVGGQEETSGKEILYRLGYFLGAAGLLVLNAALIITLIEPLGALLRLIATVQFKKDAVWRRPEKMLKQEESIRELSICTFNIAGMANFIADRNGVERLTTRREKLANHISQMKDDIICIQEGFEEFGEIAKLIQKEKPNLHILYNFGSSPFKLNSGLALISRHPIEQFKFWSHPEVGGLEVMASKGVLTATIKVSKTQSVVVVNSHLNGGAGGTRTCPEGGKEFRNRQIKHIEEHTTAYVRNFFEQNQKEKPVVLLAADYNISPTKPESDRNPTNPILDFEWFIDLAQFCSNMKELGFKEKSEKNEKGKKGKKGIKEMLQSIRETGRLGEEEIEEIGKAIKNSKLQKENTNKIIKFYDGLVYLKERDLKERGLAKKEDALSILEELYPSPLKGLMDEESYLEITNYYTYIENGIRKPTILTPPIKGKTPPIKGKTPHYSCFDMNEKGVGFNGAPETWPIKAEYVDHIHQLNQNLLDGDLREKIHYAKLSGRRISLEGGLSDHTATHVNVILE